jgi:hypothetical protein
MEMKQCRKCKKESDKSHFSLNLAKRKYYESHICKDCMNELKKGYYQRRKKTLVRSEFINAVIKDNNREYKTNELTDLDVSELKGLGYGFIFKAA